jgi:SAM-dependent methyltransferase
LERPVTAALPDSLPERKPRPGLYRFRLLTRQVPAPDVSATWVDVGGGAGEFARIVSDLGYRVTLVDGDPRNIANLEDSGIRAVLADLNLPLDALEDAAFDGASIIEVVEHVTHAERLMGEVFRLLKPGGTLLLSTPNAVWWRDRARALFGRAPAEEGYHYRFFTVKTTRALCKSAGFRVEHMEFSSPAFGVNWLARRLLGRKRRTHIRVPRVVAGLLAQTTFVVGKKP